MGPCSAHSLASASTMWDVTLTKLCPDCSSSHKVVSLPAAGAPGDGGGGGGGEGDGSTAPGDMNCLLPRLRGSTGNAGGRGGEGPVGEDGSRGLAASCEYTWGGVEMTRGSGYVWKRQPIHPNNIASPTAYNPSVQWRWWARVESRQRCQMYYAQTRLVHSDPPNSHQTCTPQNTPHVHQCRDQLHPHLWRYCGQSLFL